MAHSSKYSSYHTGTVNCDYLTDGEESQRAPSDRTMSEYMVANDCTLVAKPMMSDRKLSQEKYKRSVDRQLEAIHNSHDSIISERPRQNFHSLNKNDVPNHMYDNGSDMYVTSAAYRASSELSRGSQHSLSPSSRVGHHRAPSHYSYGSGRSGISTIKTHTSRKNGLVVETMSTPNPFCPNTKGICCLMLLLNLGLILVCLGFVIVIQFFQPVFVWILGIVFLAFGFLTLIGSLVYCVHVFRNAKYPHDINPEDLYWTRYWQGHVGSAPEVYYKAEEKYPDDGYSERCSKYSNKYYNRQNQRY